MASSSAAPTNAVLRQALLAEAATQPLRHLSRQVGVSPAGLRRFVDGAHPYSATRRKLERWYVLHGPGRLAAGLTAGSALTILRVLVDGVAPARQPETVQALVKSLCDAYATAHLAEPDWLREVRAEVERAAPHDPAGTG